MISKELKEKLNRCISIEEAKELLSERPDLDAERIWQEVERHRSKRKENWI